MTIQPATGQSTRAASLLAARMKARAAAAAANAPKAPRPPAPSRRGVPGHLLRHEILAITTQVAGNRKKLIFRGTEACTDNRTILLPELNPLACYETKDADILRGYAIHEASHSRYTDWRALTAAMDSAEAYAHRLNADPNGVIAFVKAYKRITNIIDDRYVESAVRVEYPGTYAWLSALRSNASTIRHTEITAGARPTTAAGAFMLALLSACDISNDWSCAHQSRDIIAAIGENHPAIAAAALQWNEGLRRIKNGTAVYQYANERMTELLKLAWDEMMPPPVNAPPPPPPPPPPTDPSKKPDPSSTPHAGESDEPDELAEPDETGDAGESDTNSKPGSKPSEDSAEDDEEAEDTEQSEEDGDSEGNNANSTSAEPSANESKTEAEGDDEETDDAEPGQGGNPGQSGRDGQSGSDGSEPGKQGLDGKQDSPADQGDRADQGEQSGQNPSADSPNDGKDQTGDATHDDATDPVQRPDTKGTAAPSDDQKASSHASGESDDTSTENDPSGSSDGNATAASHQDEKDESADSEAASPGAGQDGSDPAEPETQSADAAEQAAGAASASGHEPGVNGTDLSADVADGSNDNEDDREGDEDEEPEADNASPEEMAREVINGLADDKEAINNEDRLAINKVVERLVKATATAEATPGSPASMPGAKAYIHNTNVRGARSGEDIIEVHVNDAEEDNPAFRKVCDGDELEPCPKGSGLNAADPFEAVIGRRIRPLLMARRLSGVRTRSLDGILDHGNALGLALGDPDVFRSRIPTTAVNTAMMVLVDQSASTYARGLIGVLGRVAWRVTEISAGMPEFKTAMATYTSTASRTLAGSVLITHVRRFEDSPVIARRAFDTWASQPRIMNGTPTGHATLAMARHLEARREHRKILLTITDGEPDDMPAHIAANMHLRSRGIEACVLEVGPKTPGAIDMAYDLVARATDMSGVAHALTGMLETMLRGGGR